MRIFFLFLIFGSPLLASAHATITISEQGFSPSSITIPQGEEVTFKNSGKEAHWPASNIHPTHQIYSEFDPKRGLAPEEEWSFQFNKAGKWKMHDHLFPQFTGQIEVTGDTNAATSTENSSPSLRERVYSFFESAKTGLLKLYFRIFPSREAKALSQLDIFEIAKDEELLTHWVRVLGADDTMKKLLADSGNGTTRDCHQEAHQLGRISYQLFGAGVFGEGNALCHSGFYHGAMEALLREKGTADLAATITSVCSIFNTRFGNFECLHGVGHGVLAYEDYNLPAALDDCASLPDAFSQSSCYGGAFMENIVTAQGLGANPEHTTEWANDDPHFPCNAIGANYEMRYQCYQMQTSWMLTLYKQDFKRVANECLSVPEDMTTTCFQSFGRDAAGSTLRDPQKIKDLCDLIPEGDSYWRCILGAENVIVDFWGEGLTHQASDLCTLLTEPSKRTCYSALSDRLSDIFNTPQERQVVCTTFEKDYQFLCK